MSQKDREKSQILLERRLKRATEKDLLLVDLDGTLYLGDSLLDFLLFTQKKITLFTALIIFMPRLIAINLKITSVAKVKESVIARFFKGFSRSSLNKMGQMYAEAYLQKKINISLFSIIKNFPGRKIIVTASLEWWVAGLANLMGLEFICTLPKHSKTQNKPYTGFFATPNCSFEEKVRRIKLKVNLIDHPSIYAFGNTKSDHAMLRLADYAYWVNSKGKVQPYDD
ncbi:MAG: HAD family hydrolase [Ekhidna sp.]|nr:HAD family hydrolase [Ekhidna sp.]